MIVATLLSSRVSSYKEESEAATESDELIEMESTPVTQETNDAETIESVLHTRLGLVGGEWGMWHPAHQAGASGGVIPSPVRPLFPVPDHCVSCPQRPAARRRSTTCGTTATRTRRRRTGRRRANASTWWSGSTGRTSTTRGRRSRPSWSRRWTAWRGSTSSRRSRWRSTSGARRWPARTSTTTTVRRRCRASCSGSTWRWSASSVSWQTASTPYTSPGWPARNSPGPPPLTLPLRPELQLGFCLWDALLLHVASGPRGISLPNQSLMLRVVITLSKYAICPDRGFNSRLLDWRTCVPATRPLSCKATILTGVPQGSILGPLLFYDLPK